MTCAALEPCQPPRPVAPACQTPAPRTQKPVPPAPHPLADRPASLGQTFCAAAKLLLRFALPY
eukprot:11167936-Lingulodinium_polyedra.AAC.1